MMKEAEKWLRQGEADLKAAKGSFNNGNYEWTCFQSQQAAEKGLKSFLYEKGYTSIVTHSLKELLRECEKLNSSFSKIKEAAHQLDMYYIPTRYPNGLAGDIAPVDFYEKGDAEKCINYAESILTIVKKYMGS